MTPFPEDTAPALEALVELLRLAQFEHQRVCGHNQHGGSPAVLGGQVHGWPAWRSKG